MSSGRRRSSGVIESMMASIRFSSPPSTAGLGGSRHLPGAGDHADSTWPIGPIFLIWVSWLRKSSRVNRCSIMRWATRSASS